LSQANILILRKIIYNNKIYYKITGRKINIQFLTRRSVKVLFYHNLLKEGRSIIINHLVMLKKREDKIIINKHNYMMNKLKVILIRITITQLYGYNRKE
jgi:hypothetical protein